MDPPDLSLKIENLEMWEKQLQFVQMVKAVFAVNLIHVLITAEKSCYFQSLSLLLVSLTELQPVKFFPFLLGGNDFPRGKGMFSPHTNSNILACCGITFLIV